jgi:tyrosyl-tRNA synthetase
MSHASQNVLAQILSYMANADNELRAQAAIKKKREETK